MVGGNGNAPVKVELDLRASGGRKLDARLQFRNDGSTPYRLLSWLTFPTGRIDDEDYLQVSLDGQPCDYVGIVKKRPPAAAKDYLTLAPGAVVTRIVSISDAYDLPSPGMVGVLYSAINPPLDDGPPGDRLASNPASIPLR